MDQKFWNKVKKQEPWIMRIKDTWYPHPEFLEVDFDRIDRHTPLFRWAGPRSDEGRVWIHAHKLGGIEETLMVQPSRANEMTAVAIFDTIGTGTLIDRIAFHWFRSKESDMPNLERILIIKPTKSQAFAKTPTINEFLGALIKERNAEIRMYVNH